jgi:CRISPR-associated endonuclease/helicase Cas3
MDVKFNDAFRSLTGNEPFPWQRALYERFLSKRADNIPSSCNLPTGLGKTSVIAIWLLARQINRSLPRRLAYVVNRRTVVDQTTAEVERYKLIRSDLAISTLRGQFVDNREWSIDPSREAVICGTVDMIGSRLLFSGYGIGFKSRPLHAGFLGQDTLIVHDEAHLEPAFQDLLIAIQSEQHSGRFPDRYPLRVMELTATSRGEGEVFGLTEEEKHADFERRDVPEPLRIVWQRTHAKKTVRLHEESGELADELATLALAYESSGCAILVFVRYVDDLGKTLSMLPKDRTRQLTGTMRGFERDRLLLDPVFARFLPKSSRPENTLPTEGTVYLVCTSAGEVGVNISADHLVCDLSTFESMAQRFGRVNRFGQRDDTHIDIVHPAKFDDKDKLTPARRNTLALLASLDDASPAALSKLDPTARLDAFAPRPVTLPASDILFDAWSMTSVRGRMPGRPKVEPYLRGIRDWEPAQTKIAWRSEVGEITGKRLNEYPPPDLLELYPIKSHELLTDRSDRVFNTLRRLVPAGDLPIWIVDDEGGVEVTSWKRVIEGDKELIQGAVLLLPTQLGGLERGFFTGSAEYDKSVPYDVADEWRGEVTMKSRDADERDVPYDIADKWRGESQPMRMRLWSDDEGTEPKAPPGMKSVARIVVTDANDDDERTIRTWHWYVRFSAADPDAQGRQSYALQPHLNDTREAAARLVSGLPLEPELRDVIVLAAAYHDLGKDRERWQNSIGNRDYPEVKWAKSGKYAASGEHLCYRHEFGSILDMQDEPSFKRLSDDAKDLVLHLIAAHHGRARPHFNSRESLDDKHPTQATRDFAIEVPRRFARQQRKFGRWGLAYLESLVRTADYEASVKAEGGGK